MNIVVLMSDQHRQDVLGCANHAVVQTPNIDALAREGVIFNNAFCTSPLCMPSRGSFLTGTHPHTNGLVTLFNERHRSGKKYYPQAQPGIQTLVMSLRDAGFQTHGAGYLGFHLFKGEKDLCCDHDFTGFQTYDAQNYPAIVGHEIAHAYNRGRIHGEMWEPSYHSVEGEPFPYDEEMMWDRIIANRCCDFLENRRDPDRPFFLYAGFRATHTPWRAPRRFHEMYDPNDIGPLPDYRTPPVNVPRRLLERFHYFDIHHYPEDMVRRAIAGYYGFVSFLDDCVGQVVRQLDRLGLREDTLIVYTSDHGENLFSHGLCEKHTFYESSVKIPLICSMPSRLPTNVRTGALAQIHDILPTALSMANIELPPQTEGLDLQPVFRGESVRDHALVEYYHTLDPSRMIRTRRYKYIHTEDDINELYDLENDPEERLNLAWYPQYADLVAEMEAKVMEGWEIPDIPLHAQWADLNERKQKQCLTGIDIVNTRPELPAWAQRPSADAADREILAKGTLR
jgi:choline-sulfatase